MAHIKYFLHEDVEKKLTPNEKQLLEDIVGALRISHTYKDIYNQLGHLQQALQILNLFILPPTLRKNNDCIIQFLLKLRKMPSYYFRSWEDPPNYKRKKNPMRGVIGRQPLAALLSTPALSMPIAKIQIPLAIIGLMFWISYNNESVTSIKKLSMPTRRFIEKHYKNLLASNPLTFNFTESNPQQLINYWFTLIPKGIISREIQSWFKLCVKRLNNIAPIKYLEITEASAEGTIVDLPHLKEVKLNSETTAKTRRYIPPISQKSKATEDNNVDFTEISVAADHFIDEEALDQSYLYASRLALQDLMQLSLRPVALLEHERSYIVEHIKTSLDSNNIKIIKSAILTLLVLCTSKEYEYIDSLLIKQVSCDDKKDHICLQTSTWNRYDKRMPNAYEASEEQQQKHLEKTEHKLELPLPLILITALKNLIDANETADITIKDLCKDKQGTSEIIHELFSGQDKLNRNITPAGIRNMLFELISKQESPAVASLLLANTEYASNTPLYYLSQPHNKLVSLYKDSLNQLGFDATNTTIEENTYCGSELTVRHDIVKHFINVKFSGIEANYKNLMSHSDPSLDDFILLHNEITLYMIIILLITTGHRSRNEYSFSEFTIDDDKDVLLISDKQNFSDSAIRILPIANVVSESFRAYRNHCDRLARLTNKKSTALTQQLLKTSKNIKDTNQPLLYLINPDLSTATVGQKDIDKYLDIWDLPTNTFRHHFLSALQDTDAKHIAGNFMGHIRAGEHLLSNHSLFCNDDLLEMRDAINKIAAIFDCKSLNILAQKGRRISIDKYDDHHVYTPYYLHPEKVLNKKKLRKEVRVLLDRYIDGTQSSISKVQDNKDHVIQQIISDEKASTRETNFKLGQLDKFIKKIATAKNLSTISKSYTDSELKNLNLRTDTLFDSMQAKLVAKNIQDWILSKKINNNNSTQNSELEFIKVLLSLIIHGSFSFTINKNFIKALKSPVYKDGNILWLTWNADGKKGSKQRIFIDSISVHIPEQTGHPFRANPDTKSILNRTLNPV